MSEMILHTKTLPEPLVQLIHTKMVKIRVSLNDFIITPIREENIDCPLLGMFADGKISADRFMAQKQAEKELEI